MIISHLLLSWPFFLSRYFSTFILPSIILLIVAGSCVFCCHTLFYITKNWEWEDPIVILLWLAFYVWQGTLNVSVNSYWKEEFKWVHERNITKGFVYLQPGLVRFAYMMTGYLSLHWRWGRCPFCGGYHNTNQLSQSNMHNHKAATERKQKGQRPQRRYTTQIAHHHASKSYQTRLQH